MTILGALMGFFLFSGSAIAFPSYANAPKAFMQPGYAVTLTAYNAVVEQTDSNPFETASGAFSNPEIVAARSQDLAGELPFGTIIEIDGTNASKKSCGYDVVRPVVGYRVIADTMNARYTKRVDILLGNKAEYKTTDKGMKNAAQILGICEGIVVRVVGNVGIKDIPKTQAELTALIGKTSKDIALK